MRRRFLRQLASLVSVVALAALLVTSAFAAEAKKEQLGAFEITALQRAAAAKNEVGYLVLDAGRGNPN